MDFQLLAYDVCRSYVSDQKGCIDDNVINLVLGWIRSRDIGRLSSCPDYVPQAYSCEALCRFTRQVAAFFKKNKAFANPIVCQEAASKAFFKAEEICRITNKRLDYYYRHPERLSSQLRADVERVESVIADILGDIADFYEVLPREIRVTAGATSTRSRRHSLPYLKVRLRNMPATKSAQPYLRTIASILGYDKVSFKTVCANRVETVPKNWKTDRTIACEPEGNLFLQLALDGYIKERLRPYGVNLSDQSWNQSLARKASIDGNFSTIDLSMASDTVAMNTVALLFPRKWFRLAADFRTPFGRGFGRTIRYEKFSSMGNGSTFGIETLIFTACCRAIGCRKYAVYGDDIIVPTQKTDRLLALLRYLGFRQNQDKSFTEGSFRESCGADWFSGRDVTPFYLRSANSMKIELCHVVNGLANIVSKEGALAERLAQLVTEHDLPFVPFNGSSVSGVWIYPHDAYGLGLIRTDRRFPGLSFFMAFCPKNKTRFVRDSRTLFLWHLDANRNRARSSQRTYHPYLKGFNIPFHEEVETSCIIRSEVPLFTHKYKWKRVSWIPHPGMVTPTYLYWWSDFITRRKAGMKVRT